MSKWSIDTLGKSNLASATAHSKALQRTRDHAQNDQSVRVPNPRVLRAFDPDVSQSYHNPHCQLRAVTVEFTVTGVSESRIGERGCSDVGDWRSGAARLIYCAASHAPRHL